MARPLILYDDDGGERELPLRFEICPTCDGHGQSSAYLGAFTGDQMREDPDFADDYRRGRYDRACDECGGTGKVKAPDWKRISAADRKAYERQEREDAECRAIERAERLFEGGWREEGWFGE
ncbi:MAG: hypothetical protein ACRECF_05440 [Methyloceanibacter sp.]